jgi:hypothetical protein
MIANKKQNKNDEEFYYFATVARGFCLHSGGGDAKAERRTVFAMARQKTHGPQDELWRKRQEGIAFGELLRRRDEPQEGNVQDRVGRLYRLAKTRHLQIARIQ